MLQISMNDNFNFNLKNSVNHQILTLTVVNTIALCVGIHRKAEIKPWVGAENI